MIREVNVSQLTDVVERLCIEANEHLPSDVKCAIEHCRACEDGEIAQGVLDNIIENYKIADAENVPICQDTGMACVFLEIGQDVHLTGGDLVEAIDEGVRRGYDKGYLIPRWPAIKMRCLLMLMTPARSPRRSREISAESVFSPLRGH